LRCFGHREGTGKNDKKKTARNEGKGGKVVEEKIDNRGGRQLLAASGDSQKKGEWEGFHDISFKANLKLRSRRGNSKRGETTMSKRN